MAGAKGFILNVYELDLTPIGERVLPLPIRIGRSSLNDVCVSHRLVSEFHARIEEIDGRLCVRDLSSKNGVLVETVGSEGAARVAAQTPVDLEPYGYEFLLSPLLRVRLRPAAEREVVAARHSQAVGSVLGNAALVVNAASALAEDKLTAAFAARDAPVPAAAPLAPARGDGERPSPAHVPVLAASSPPPSVPPPPTLQPLPAASAVGHPVASGPPRPARSAFARTAPQGSPVSASPVLQPYSSVLVEPPAGSLELPPLAGTAAHAEAAPAVSLAPEPGWKPTRLSPSPPSSSPPNNGTLLEPVATPQPIVPPLAHTAWEGGSGTLPAVAEQASRPAELPGRSLEALALRGLRELAASLLPGQPVESAGDIVQLVTKLHDAFEMFCRCFIPVREACSRYIPTDELERAAIERCRTGSASYVAIERALEPRAVAAALLDWRNDDQDAPRAVEHILADLMLHHLAFSQAALEGTHALFEELSPERLEAQQAPPSPSVLSRLGLTSTREKELWEAYARRHADLESAGRAFRALFGEQFARAYAAQFPGPGSGGSS